eukprot:237325_1
MLSKLWNKYSLSIPNKQAFQRCNYYQHNKEKFVHYNSLTYVSAGNINHPYFQFKFIYTARQERMRDLRHKNWTVQKSFIKPEKITTSQMKQEKQKSKSNQTQTTKDNTFVNKNISTFNSDPFQMHKQNEVSEDIYTHSKTSMISKQQNLHSKLIDSSNNKYSTVPQNKFKNAIKYWMFGFAFGCITIYLWMFPFTITTIQHDDAMYEIDIENKYIGKEIAQKYMDQNEKALIVFILYIILILG